MTGAFAWRERGGVRWLAAAALERAGPVVASFSTRLGGTSVDELDSLNIGFKVGDDPERVRENRRRLCAAMGLEPVALTAARQVHGTNVAVVTADDRGRGSLDPARILPPADGIVTNAPGVALLGFFADCVPILLYDPRRGAVGLAHAGWRGTVAGVAAKAVATMARELGSDPGDILAAIGPAIRPCCYVVDDVVAVPLREACGGFVGRRADGRTTADLGGANCFFLQSAGVKAENIYDSGLCTSCCADLFFSHRRQAGQAGRMAAVIALRGGSAGGCSGGGRGMGS